MKQIITKCEKFTAKTDMKIFNSMNLDDLQTVALDTDNKIFWAHFFLEHHCGANFEYKSLIGHFGDEQIVKKYYLDWLFKALKLKDTLLKEILMRCVYDTYVIYCTNTDRYWEERYPIKRYHPYNCCLRIVR